MKKKNISFGVFIAMVVVFAVIGIAGLLGGGDNSEGKSLDELVSSIKCDVTSVDDLEKAPISMEENSLYDELPEIEKYPLTAEGRGDINLEIFSSPEKAEEGTDGWLVDIVNEFNRENYQTSNGSTVSVSVRDITSGLAADYIISGKYVPELYSPSSELWGCYISSKNVKIEEVSESLVGNTAGILVKKDSGYKTFDDVYQAVVNGELNMGYTNPQVSTAGMNLLIEIIKDYGSDKFSDFQSNIPYVAYNTVQLKNSASMGKLDAIISEYQSYASSKEMQKTYDFIPYGIRHDNPLYACNYTKMSDETKEAIQIFIDYAKSNESQNEASKCGFNGNEGYKSSYTVAGSDVTDALEIYKEEKDSGRDVIAVFVSDCSGSMDGEAIMQLKESLSNGMQYIKDDAYIGLVSYSTNVQKDVPIAKFDITQRAYFQNAVNNMTANGGTSTYEALCVALQMIEIEKVNHENPKCMIFLLSDGRANGSYSYNTVEFATRSTEIPIYTIAYTDSANKDELKALSDINEAAAISAQSDDVVYQIKSLFNANL